jgi:hypothetical protein
LQVLAIILGIIIFATPVTALSALGVFVTCIGIAWYTFASYTARASPPQTKETAASEVSGLASLAAFWGLGQADAHRLDAAQATGGPLLIKV